jgi:hypothetical protein
MRTNYSIAVVLLISGLAAIAIRSPRVNPPVEQSHTIDAVLAPPAGVSRTLQRSCADCHSNQTKWPWYSRVEPAASLIGSDVERGRAAMNFSEWPTDSKGVGLLLGACAAMESGIMPKQPYRAMHPDAVPTRDQVQEFCNWSREQAQRLMSMRRRNKPTSETQLQP